MPKLTNKLGLPEPIVNAVRKDSYSKGSAHISITGLCSPARIRVLTKKHEAEIEEDVSERIWSLLGQVMHGILERAGDSTQGKSAIYEKRWYTTVDGVNISGQLDAYYEKGLIQDYKLVSLYSVKDGPKQDYVQQLNCYAYLLRQNGMVVNDLELVCILRDWSKRAAQNDPSIPQQQVVKLKVPVWSDKRAEDFVIERVRVHKEASKKLPECTAEERWATPDKWAVMPKLKAPRSLRNYADREDAEAHSAKVKGSFVEVRPGNNARCETYCSVSKWCTQFKKLQGENNE